MSKPILHRRTIWPSSNGGVAICNMTDDHIIHTQRTLYGYSIDRTTPYVDGKDTLVSRTGFTIREWMHALQREQKQRKREAKKAHALVFGLAAKRKFKKGSYR